MSRCRLVQNRFRELITMRPSEIRSWANDPRAKWASLADTRRRLPKLAKLVAKNDRAWTAGDCQYAQRVNSFNARMQGMVNKWGCTTKAVISLRNWGRQPPRCDIPKE